MCMAYLLKLNTVQVGIVSIIGGVWVIVAVFNEVDSNLLISDVVIVHSLHHI